jgi:serine/threonine-protein kinase
MQTRYGCPDCLAVFRSGFARCPLDGAPLQELVQDPLANSLFADRYVIEDCIGEGGMGRVYRARHQRMSRLFAIKVLYGDHATDPKMRDRFAREAESASRLHHPNVISVTDFGETDQGLLFLVMDFVEGRELGDLIAATGPLAADRVRTLLRQLALGLAHAHDKGLVHRDFKGENVIVTGEPPDEVARIVDFGIAVLRDEGEGRLTTEGMVLGTPAYMSPEQATGSELDARTDLYSLGVLTYEMLAGVLPFDGSPMAVARMHLSMEPPPISERVPGVVADPALEAIALQLMEKRPEDRYQSAAALIAALDATVETPRPSPQAAVAVVIAPPSAAAEPAPDHATDEVAAPRSSRRWLLALPVLLAGVVLVYLLAIRSSGKARGSGASQPDAAAVVSVGARDAAVVAVAVSPDAGVAPAMADAAPRPAVTPPTSVARKRRVDAGTRVVEPKPPVTDERSDLVRRRSSIDRRYVALGEAIQQMGNAQGSAAAAPLWQRYRKIPIADAMIKDSLVGQVESHLTALERDVKRLLP